MMLTGKIEKPIGGLWGAECEAIGAFTQGKSRKDAAEMLADCIEVKVGRDGFKVKVTEIGTDDDAIVVLIESEQDSVLLAELLKHQRKAHNMTLADVQKKLGASSLNAYAAYEQGKREPSVGKLRELLAVIAPELVMTIGPRSSSPAKRKAKAAR